MCGARRLKVRVPGTSFLGLTTLQLVHHVLQSEADAIDRRSKQRLCPRAAGAIGAAVDRQHDLHATPSPLLGSAQLGPWLVWPSEVHESAQLAKLHVAQRSAPCVGATLDRASGRPTAATALRVEHRWQVHVLAWRGMQWGDQNDATLISIGDGDAGCGWPHVSKGTRGSTGHAQRSMRSRANHKWTTDLQKEAASVAGYPRSTGGVPARFRASPPARGAPASTGGRPRYKPRAPASTGGRGGEMKGR